MKTTIRLLPALTMALALGACSIGPDYARPSVETSTGFKEAQGWKVAQPKDHLPRGKWWTLFGDQGLNDLEDQVEVSSQTLRIAEAQFRQARALAQAARAGFFPAVTAAVSTSRGGNAANNGTSSRSHALSLDASWEADIWGRIGRTVESGEAGLQAGAADLEAARLSIQATLAQNYFLLRAADEQKTLLERTVADYEKSLQIVRNQYAAGTATRADIAQAETQLKSAQAQAIDIRIQRAQLEHAIALLAGKPPALFALPPGTLNPILPDIPVGMASDLLERRPDIAAAERRAAAANAQIGVARAAFFPALTLSAATGFQSASLANWLTAPNRFWSLGPTLAATLFDGGLRRAHSEQAVAAYDQSVAAYRQTVLGGFQEAEDNLVALRLLADEARVQDEAVQAARESVRLTTNQYRAGTVGYLNVVNVQVIAYNNERTALIILGRRLTAAVLLIKALGGGWNGFGDSVPVGSQETPPK
jgi:NodT family efflux transporter outer membrane factor (OMF) lipoprotein